MLADAALATPYCGGGVVESGGMSVAESGVGVSDGGTVPGSAGIGSGEVAGGAESAGAGGIVVISALSSFFAQPAANNIADMAIKTKARMLSPPDDSDCLGPY